MNTFICIALVLICIPAIILMWAIAYDVAKTVIKEHKSEI